MQTVTAELRRAMPVEAASLEPVSVVRHLHTYPQYRLGMFEKLLRLKATEGKPKGLYFAGDYTDGGADRGRRPIRIQGRAEVDDGLVLQCHETQRAVLLHEPLRAASGNTFT